MPATTFDQLGDIRNVCTEQNITIQTTDWSSTAPYTYDWTSTMIAANSDVEVMPRDGAEAAQIEDFEYEKSVGKVTFTVDSIPAAALPLTVKIINAKPGGLQSLNASDISYDGGNVEDELDDLNSSITHATLTEGTHFTISINTGFSKINCNLYKITDHIYYLYFLGSATNTVAANSQAEMGTLSITGKSIQTANVFAIEFYKSNTYYSFVGRIAGNGTIYVSNNTGTARDGTIRFSCVLFVS